MASPSSKEDPKTLFEELVPLEVKADPDRLTYYILSEYSATEIDEVCTTWKLTKNQAKLLKKIWRTHPDLPTPAPQHGTPTTSADLPWTIIGGKVDEISVAKINTVWKVGNIGLSGLGADVNQVDIFVRGETIRLWDALEAFLDSPNHSGMFVDGQPGVGKSTELFGWAINCNQQERKAPNLIWMHSSGFLLSVLKIKNGEILHLSIMRASIRITMEQLILQDVYDLYIIDGTFADECAQDCFAACIKLRKAKKVILCTSYSAPSFNTAALQEIGAARLTKHTVFNWEFEEYMEAMKKGISFPCIKDTMTVNDEKEKAMKEHHFYAGGSIRLMLLALDLVIKALTDAISGVSSFQCILNGDLGEKSETTKNTLFQTFSSNGGVDKETSFVSKYVLNVMSKKVDQSFIDALEIINVDNPSWQGWVWELKVLQLFRKAVENRQTLSFQHSEDSQSRINFSLKTTVDYSKDKTFKLCDKVICIPLAWNNACFDGVIYENVDSKHKFTFFNATIAESHAFDLSYVSFFLAKFCDMTANTTRAGVKRPFEDAISRKFKPEDIEVHFALITKSKPDLHKMMFVEEKSVENFDVHFDVNNILVFSDPKLQS